MARAEVRANRMDRKRLAECINEKQTHIQPLLCVHQVKKSQERAGERSQRICSHSDGLDDVGGGVRNTALEVGVDGVVLK